MAADNKETGRPPQVVSLPLDTVQRIEGPLRAEIVIRDGLVTEARVSGGMYRGFETILLGRDPRDAAQLVQRLCASCSTAHAVAASLALEQAAGVKVPSAARLIRNLILAADFLQAHLLHFYRFALPDYVPDLPGSSLTARGSQNRNRAIAEQCRQAFEMRVLCHEAAALFGGRMPHPQSIAAGGVTCKPDRAGILGYTERIKRIKDFLSEKYLPLVYATAARWKPLAERAAGCRNMLCVGAFPMDEGGRRFLFSPGVVMEGKDLPFDATLIREDVKYAWFATPPESPAPLRLSGHPSPDKAGAYSFIKAACYAGKPMEVGPLARLWINDVPLSETGRDLAAELLGKKAQTFRELGEETAFSVMGRHIAGAEESLFVAEAIATWLQQLDPADETSAAFAVPLAAEGLAFTESPHGSLTHYMRVENGAIAVYVIVSPSMWNCAPRNSAERRGPLEEALIGLPVPDAANPVSVTRMIRAFAPCPGCAAQ